MVFSQIDSGFITVTGTDRIDFVHGLLSSDVRGLAAGQGTGALLLNHRGHALAQMTVVRLPDSLLLAVEGQATPLVLQELQDHVIFDQVEISDSSGDWSQLTVQGVAAESLPVAVTESSGLAALVPCRRSPEGGFDVFLQGGTEAVTAVLLQHGATPLDGAQLDVLRVRGLVAAAAHEAGEGVLPQESGLEHLVSYRKGCYLGQEIMARIEARGRMRRGLTRLDLQGEPAGTERDIRLDGRLVGRLGTVVHDPDAGWSALAVLRSDLAEGVTLELSGTTARVSS